MPETRWTPGALLARQMTSGSWDVCEDATGETVARCKSERWAKLFESAPDLYEALQMLLVQIGEYKDGDGAAKFHALNIARAALAKADGHG